MKKILKRIGIVLLVITFPVWIVPVVFMYLAIAILDEVFNISWNK